MIFPFLFPVLTFLEFYRPRIIMFKVRIAKVILSDCVDVSTKIPCHILGTHVVSYANKLSKLSKINII